MRKLFATVLAILMVLCSFSVLAFAAGDGFFSVEIVNENGAKFYKESELESETYPETIPAGERLDVERIFYDTSTGIGWAELYYGENTGYVLIDGDETIERDAREVIEPYKVRVKNQDGVAVYADYNNLSKKLDIVAPYNSVYTVNDKFLVADGDQSYELIPVTVAGTEGYIALNCFNEDGTEVDTGVEYYDGEEIVEEESSGISAPVIAAICIAAIAIVAVVIVVLKKKKK